MSYEVTGSEHGNASKPRAQKRPTVSATSNVRMMDWHGSTRRSTPEDLQLCGQSKALKITREAQTLCGAAHRFSHLDIVRFLLIREQIENLKSRVKRCGTVFDS